MTQPIEDRFSRYVVSVVRPPDGWRIHSVKPYCGTYGSLVWEFVRGGDIVTLYGDCLSVQDQLRDRPEFRR